MAAATSSSHNFVSSFSFISSSKRPITSGCTTIDLSPNIVPTATRTGTSSSSLSSRPQAFRLYQSAVVDDEIVQDEAVPPGSSGVQSNNDGSSIPSSSTSSTNNNSNSRSPGKPIARGSIVRAFPGGLVAVRIDQDFMDQSDAAAAAAAAAADVEVDATQQQEGEQEHPSSPMNPNNNRPQKSRNNDLGGDLMGRQVIFGAVQDEDSDDSDGNNKQQFEGMMSGVVVIHRPPVIFVYANNDDKTQVPMEGSVTVLSNLYSIDVAEEIRQVNGFGKGSFLRAEPETDSSSRPIFAPIPQVKDIALINKPLITGVTMFDALAPIGKGQNMLMIGHDIDDMRRYVIGDMLKIQASTGTKCVYASTGDSDAQIMAMDLLEKTGISDQVTLVSKSQSNVQIDKDDEPSDAAEATVVAATACAIGESFALEHGKDVLVVVDTIDQHKKLWDTTTHVLVDVFGVDSVVKGDRDGGASSEMRAFFSSLVQRSAQFNAKRGGGSVTLLLLQSVPPLPGNEEDESHVFTIEDFDGAPDKVLERLDLLVQKKIPLTAATLRKIQLPVPSMEEGRRRLSLQHVDDLISMSDGQIWLDEQLAQSGRQPAFDFQRSITRVGIGADTNSRADAAAMRRVVEGLRLDLSQAESMDGAEESTNASKKQKRNAAAWLLAMHQPSAAGARRLSESCVALLAASTCALNDSIDSGIVAGSEAGTQLMRNLLDHVNTSVPKALEEIDATQDFTEESKAEISNAIQSFFDAAAGSS